MCSWSAFGLIHIPIQSRSEDSFRIALANAREPRTRCCELRAATSLARLWREQGRQGEARDLPAPLYGSFTEGFDTADLKGAKALLDTLASAGVYSVSVAAAAITVWKRRAVSASRE